MPSPRFQGILSLGLTAAAIAVAAAVVRREFFPAAGRSQPAQGSAPVFEPEWRSILPSALEAGNPKAPVRIIEFFDLECPACRDYHNQTVREVLRRFKDSLAISFVHYPLNTHRFARIAATALECAAEQGRFSRFMDTVYELQDSIGLLPWSAFALRAAIPDTVHFVACLRNRNFPRVDSGIALAGRFGVRGTPGIMVNGWHFNSPPSTPELTRTVEGLLTGQEPVGKR